MEPPARPRKPTEDAEVAAIEAAEAVMAPIAAHHAALRAGLDPAQLVGGLPDSTLFDAIQRAQKDAMKHSPGYGKEEGDPYRALRLIAAGVRAKSDAGVRAASPARTVGVNPV